MIKAILFDFWGTLAEQGVYSPIKQVRNILRIRMPFPEFVIRFEKAMMLHPFNDLQDTFLSLGEELNIEITRREMDDLIGMWNKSWMLAELYPEVEDALKQLKEKYTLVLVANTNKSYVEKVVEKFKLSSYFDKVFLSYQEGMIKTDREFFLRVVQELGLSVEECVMVGDSMQSDILAAQEAGMKAILVDRKNARDYAPKIARLLELEGVL